MSNKIKAAFLTVMILLSGVSISAQGRLSGSYRKALDLYNHGMFERAGVIFDQISDETGDVLARGYKTLCSVRLQENGYESAVANYLADSP